MFRIRYRQHARGTLIVHHRLVTGRASVRNSVVRVDFCALCTGLMLLEHTTKVKIVVFWQLKLVIRRRTENNKRRDRRCSLLQQAKRAISSVLAPCRTGQTQLEMRIQLSPPLLEYITVRCLRLVVRDTVIIVLLYRAIPPHHITCYRLSALINKRTYWCAPHR